MLNRLKSVFNDQQFRPSWWGILINPFYIARKGLYEHIRSLGGSIIGDVLDVGCGQKPYQNMFNSSEYIGLELDTPDNRRNKKADIFYDGVRFPFPDDRFDGVVINQVFEHIFNPGEFLGEVRRVLKTGGSLLLTVPFVWDEHEQPHDFARYSSFGLRSILEQHGFVILEQRKSVNDISLLFQLLNAYLYKVTVTRNKFVNACITSFLMAPVTLAGLVAAKLFPGNDDLYLDNIVLARKIADE